MSDRLIGLLAILVAALFFAQTLYFKKPPFAAFESLGPEFFPRGILIGLALLGLVLLIRGEGSLLPNWNASSLRALTTRYRGVVLSLVLFPVYIISITLFGFAYATVAYLITMQLLLHPRRGRGLVYVIVGSIAFAWALVFLFEGYLHVVLPKGELFY